MSNVTNLSYGSGRPPRRGDIDFLVFDFDGVLTDNRVQVSSDGTETIVCNRADGWGISLLRSAGLKMAIVSTETNPVVRRRGEKLHLPVYQAVGDKADIVRRLAADLDIALDRVGFVGNDTNDLPALAIVGWPMCPSDGHAKVRAAARWVVDVRGGEGVARVLADMLLSEDH